MLTVILWHISTQTKQLCDQQLSLWCLKPMQCVCTSMYQWSVGSPYNCSRVLYLDEAIIRPATLTWFNQLLASGASYIPIWLDRNFSTNVSMFSMLVCICSQVLGAEMAFWLELDSQPKFTGDDKIF